MPKDVSTFRGLSVDSYARAAGWYAAKAGYPTHVLGNATSCAEFKKNVIKGGDDFWATQKVVAPYGYTKGGNIRKKPLKKT